LVSIDDGHDSISKDFAAVGRGLALALLAGVLDALVNANGAAPAVLANRTPLVVGAHSLPTAFLAARLLTAMFAYA
jgi:hypothetical protein